MGWGHGSRSEGSDGLALRAVEFIRREHAASSRFPVSDRSEGFEPAKGATHSGSPAVLIALTPGGVSTSHASRGRFGEVGVGENPANPLKMKAHHIGRALPPQTTEEPFLF